jgi:phosphoserine phosphatase
MENHLRQLHKLIVFDLDHTLISTNSSYTYLKLLYQLKVLSFPVLLRALFLRFQFYATSMTLEELHHKAFDLTLHGLPLKTLEKHVDLLLDKLLPGSLYLPVFQELTAAKERGDHIMLLSSSPNFIVQRFAAYFGIDFWDSTVYGIDKENCLCKIAKLMVGTQKKICLLEHQKLLGISKPQVVVYTDSHDDIPLLLQAGQAIAVNPDKKLAKFAKLNQWRII